MMESRDSTVVSRHDANQGSLASYTSGFVLSVLFTLAPYYIVTHTLLSGPLLVVTLVGFALLQLLVQLLFFLHVGRESHPRWNTMALLFASIVVFILAVGSLWIMNNLDYNMGTPRDMDKQMLEEEGMHH